MTEWKIKKLKDIVDFNPKEHIAKNELAKKIAMEQLQPFCRDIPTFELKPFSGGTKFRNGDTIMARITPCLENGKIAKVGILDNMKLVLDLQNMLYFVLKMTLMRILSTI